MPKTEIKEGIAEAKEEAKDTKAEIQEKTAETETSEEKAAKEYQKNIERLNQSAEDFIKKIQASQAQERLTLEAVSLPPPAPTLTLEQQRSYDQKRTSLWGSAKENLQKLSLQLKGIENRDSLIYFVHYLQKNITTTESKYQEVSRSQLEQEIKKYQAQGYEAREAFSFEKDKVQLEIKKFHPYKFKREHTKNLDLLLNQPNDPIEIIERLKRLGFNIDEHAFDYYFEDLFSLTSSPEALTLLCKLEQTGIKGYHFLSEKINDKKITQVIIEMAERESQEELLKPNIQQRIRALVKNFGQSFGLEQLSDLIALAGNEKSFDLLERTARNEQGRTMPKYFIRNLHLLQNQGLVELVIKILDLNINTPSLTELLSYHAESLTKAQEIINRDLPDFLKSPELSDLLADQEFLNFTTKVSLLCGQKISLQKEFIDQYRKLAAYPETIALFEFFRKNQLKDWPWQYSYRLEELLKDKKEIKTLVKPEFQDFLTALKDKLGYQLDWWDMRGGQPIIKLFDEPETQEKILSPAGQDLINYLGGFRLDEKDVYLDLLAMPGTLTTLKKLEETFGYQRRLERGNYGIQEIIELTTDKELQAEVFSEKTKAFFDELAVNFKYKFHPKNCKTLRYYALIEPGAWQRRVFHPKSIEFINKTIGTYDLGYLDIYFNLEEKMQNLILRLSDCFGYRIDLKGWWYASENWNQIKTLSDNLDWQKQLFSEARIELIRQLQKTSSYRFQPKDMESLINLPLDFGAFTQELKEKFNYNFHPQDVTILARLAQNKEIIYSFFDELKKIETEYAFNIKDVDSLVKLANQKEAIIILLKYFKDNCAYKFTTNDTAHFIEMAAYAPEAIIERLSLLAPFLPGYQLKPSDIQYFSLLIDKNYNLEEIKELNQLYQQYKDGYSMAELNINLFPILIDLRENKDQIADVVKKLKEIGIVINPFYSVPTLKTIAQDDLLPVIEFLYQCGQATSSLHQLDKLKEFRQRPDYQEIVARYKILHSYTKQPFNFDDFNWYTKSLTIDNLEQKLGRWQQRVTRTPITERELKIFLACAGEMEKIEKVSAVINNNYFQLNKDAQHNLHKFLQRFESGNYPDEVFFKIVTASKEARKVKQLVMRTMAIEDLHKVINPEQKFDYSFLEEGKEYSEIYEKANKRFIEMATQVLFTGEDSDIIKEEQEKIEDLLQKDEQFEDDFRVITDSIAIYAAKFNPQQVNFKELLRAISQALDLTLIRDSQKYQQERFNRSQEQFDRIFEQLPIIDRQKIEQRWLDTSLVTQDTLKATTIAQEAILKNKLNEIRVTFETEILPDLIALFKEKLAGLEQAAEKQDKNQALSQLKLDIFKKYLLNEDNVLKTDVIAVYKNLLRDVKIKEHLLKSKEAAADDKKQASKELGTMKTLKDALKGIYKLSTIQPQKISSKIDYAEQIDDITGLLSSSLHRLAIVDKEKKLTEEIGSNLEIDLRDHLQRLEEVISEEDHPKRIKIATQFVTDFNSLARCPELTNSCQRLTEVTNYNESAYSRILDGINELIDLWEIKEGKGPKGKRTLTKNQRLARCFTELAPIKIGSEKMPRLTLLLDRIYTHPQYLTFQNDFAENIIKTALVRFQDQPEMTMLFSPRQFSGYLELIKTLAPRYGYRFREAADIQYFVNESHLKMNCGKYYDAHGGPHDTTKSYYDSTGAGYLLEKIT